MNSIPKPRNAADAIADDERSVSEVVGVALLIGIVIIGMATILYVGTSEIGGDREAIEVSQAEQALTEFDSAAGRVGTGSTSSQEVDLGLRTNRGTLDVEENTGNITVEYVDFFDNGTSWEVMNTSMGTVVYESGDTTVGYQGGGVWRSDGNSSMMVSPPEISFREKTLTMPVVKTTRGGSVHSNVQITGTGTEERFPTDDLTNRAHGAQIVITIESRYCEGWERFFEDETGSIVQGCEYGPEDQLVVILLALPTNFAPDAGVIATSGPGEIRLAGTGAYIDSYNSSKGPYEQSNTSDGIVKAAGNIIMKGDSEIAGDSHAGQDIAVDSNSAFIDGDARANGTVKPEDEEDREERINGTVDTNAPPVQEIPPINELVKDKLAEVANENDNDNATVIEDEELAITEENDTLEAGAYYLETLDLQGETLVLDTTEGNITLAVRNWVNLEKSGNDNSHIVVEGDGDVRLFVGSEKKVDVSVPGKGQAPQDLDEVHFFVERNGTIDVPEQKSPRFQVFAPDNFVGAIGGSSSENADVTATVIAPAGRQGPGHFYVQHGELYGAVVTGNLTLGQYGQVHFDRALLDEEIPLAPNVPRFEYLWLTEDEIKVED